MRMQNLYESDLDFDKTHEELEKSPLIIRTHGWGLISEGGAHHQGCGGLEFKIKGFENYVIQISRKGKILFPLSDDDEKEKKLMMDILVPLLVKKDGSTATLVPKKTIGFAVDWKNGVPPKNIRLRACARGFGYELRDVYNDDDDEVALLKDVIALSGLPENKPMLPLKPTLEVPMHLKKLEHVRENNPYRNE